MTDGREDTDASHTAELSDAERAEAERLAAKVFGEKPAAEGGRGGDLSGLGAEGAPGRGLGGPGGDDQGSGVAGLGGLGSATGGGAAGGLDSRNLGGGGAGFGQTQGVARQNQAFGLGGERPSDPTAQGGANPLEDELRAHAAAQARPDADDAQGLLDKTRAQTDVGADPNNDNL